MNIKNLWVGNVYNCAFVDDIGFFITEPGEQIVGCVLKKVDEFLYQSLSNGNIYTTQDMFGANKVDEKSIKPLSSYYTPIFKLKRKSGIHSEEVYKNVKLLRKNRKI